MTAVDLTRAGLQTLEHGAAALLRSLDAVFEGWGTSDGADSMIMPALLAVEDLADLDVYDNFPHQALVVSPLDLTRRDGTAQRGRTRFVPDELVPATLALPTAACFAVYLHMRGRHLEDGRRITVLGRCFRQEEHYEGLRRLMGFHMREIVALGTREFITEHLRLYAERIEAFAGELGLSMRIEAASDPFFDRGGQRALLQRLSPVKHEFLVGELAIASVNIHRNFFGERCDIRLTATGELAFTGCVAFGLERWLAVLWERYGDWTTAAQALSQAARPRVEEAP